MNPSPTFPEGFVWGAATAAAQIEGGTDADGRGPSIWDEFCRQPGRILNGDTTATACDFYHRWHEDIALMKQIGLQAFRFSVSWSRVLPEGVGSINQAGLDFYSRLVDGLIEAGIRPYLTLYHWDLPQALHLRGGWMNREIADQFADYADVMARHLGDRVKDWITFNEPQIFLGFGYSDGSHAPGLKLPHAETMRAAHHVNLAHGRAVSRIRQHVIDSKIGFAIATKIGIPVRPEDPACVEAARRFTIDPEWSENHEVWLDNAWWPEPMIHGRYPAALERHLPGFLDSLPAGDLAEIQQPLDFFGFNYYFGRNIETATDRPWRVLPDRPGEQRTFIGWPVHPEGMYWASRFFHERYQLPLYVFENGLSSMDWVGLDGRVQDAQRIDFLTRYLRQFLCAHDEGIPLAGYFHWSLLDNFEWTRGYRERFGLIHVDYDTLVRTPKDSAQWYGEVIRSNGGALAT
jgi:beta-glucosidase